jgi:hypothetical protein
MTLEANAFAEFMQKANDSRKAISGSKPKSCAEMRASGCRSSRLLDHVFALQQAGVRSAQPNVREQLTLSKRLPRRRPAHRPDPIEAVPDEPFDEQRHQLLDPAASPPGAVAKRSPPVTPSKASSSVARWSASRTIR